LNPERTPTLIKVLPHGQYAFLSLGTFEPAHEQKTKEQESRSGNPSGSAVGAIGIQQSKEI